MTKIIRLGIITFLCTIALNQCAIDEFENRGNHYDPKSPNYGLESPSVSITWPILDGFTILEKMPRNFTITGTAEDDVEVIAVEIQLDQESDWIQASGTTSWFYNFRNLSIGQHILKIRATDDYASNKDSITEITFDCRLTGDIKTITSQEFPVENPSMAFNGEVFGIVWQDDSDSDESYQIKFGSTDLKNTSEIQGVVVSVSTSNQEHPDLTTYETLFATVFEDYRNAASSPDIYLVQFDRQATEQAVEIVTKEVFISEQVGSQTYPKIASNQRYWGVTWQDSSQGTNDIYFASCYDNEAGNLIVEDPFPILLGKTTDAIQYDVSALNDGFFIVWSEMRNGQRNLYGKAVNPVTRSIGFEILLTDDSSDQQNPSISCNGSQICIAYETTTYNGDVAFILLDQYGAIIKSSGISNLPSQQSSPIVEDMGSNFGVIWKDDRTGTNQLFYRLISNQGSFISEEDPIENSEGLASNQRAVSFGSYVLGLVWDHTASDTNSILFTWESDL